jgi:hypothetical protein
MEQMFRRQPAFEHQFARRVEQASEDGGFGGHGFALFAMDL